MTRGSTHFLKHLAFRENSENFGLTLVRHVESLGGEFIATIDRDMIGYHIYAPSDKIEKLATLLPSIASPKLWEWEVNEVRDFVKREISQINRDVPNLIMESLYQNAFRTSGLGQGVYSNEFDAGRIVPQHIYKHVQDFYYGEGRNVVIANGFNHAYQGKEFESFTNKAGTFELNAYESLPDVAQTSQDTKFIGGQSFVQGGKTVHVAIGYKGGCVISKDQGALLVLKELLGCSSQCGGSLYKLAHGSNWIIQANAFNSSFTDKGVFGIYAEAKGKIGDLTHQLVQTLTSLKNVSDEDFQIAKNTAIGRAIRSGESKLNQNTLNALRFFRDGTKTPINDRSEEIRNVTKNQVTDLITKLQSSGASYVTAGDVPGTPSISAVLSQ